LKGVELIDENGAPQAEKIFHLHPPGCNKQLGIRRSYVNETRSVALHFLQRGLQTIVFANSRLITNPGDLL
jgi:DEAD/DEAH box helicase domain-containing protein